MRSWGRTYDGVYKGEKALVDDCVKQFLEATSSALSQAQGNAVGFDGISSREAAQNSNRFATKIQTARLFCIHPNHWETVYVASARVVAETISPGWETAVRGDTADIERRFADYYRTAGKIYPFPDQMPFDSVFFCYGGKMELHDRHLYSRVTPEGLAQMGATRGRLVGHLLCWDETAPVIFSVMLFDTQPTASMGVGITYADGEWFQPDSHDNIVLGMLVRYVNEHKQVVDKCLPTFANRLQRREESEKAGQQLPLPSPFYLVHLRDELVKPPAPPVKPPVPPTPVQHSHRWDVRGHEVVRVARGEMPLTEKDRKILKRRGYTIYEGMSLSGEDAGRLLKRGVHAPGPREWIAVLAFWREAHIKGPPEAPYVPAARVGA